MKSHSRIEAIDTNTPIGRVMRHLIGVLAELERTRASANSTQRRGLKFGLKPTPAPDQVGHARKLMDKRTRRYEAGRLNVGGSTLCRTLQVA